MFGGLGPLEIIVLLVIFFVLFGAERLPKMANALGRSKGEFQKGLNEVTSVPSTSNTEADLENDGKTEAVDIAQKAEAAGIDPSGKTTEEVKEEIKASEE